MGTETTKTDFYRLTFGDVIALKGEQPEEFILDQGTRTELSDGNKSYFILLHGIKVNRKIYQPTEIEAELDFMENVVDPSNQEQTAAPQFDDVRQLLLQREVTLDFVGDNATLNIAKNCYVYELIPQLYKDTYGMKMYVKLSIFSMDKLMTLNKYSKAYVARKLGLEILLPESLNFGTISEGVPLIESYVGNLQHLTYTEDGKKLEFIQPYLVQYNESFYDFLVRTANRCGEFLFFEDGKLVLGLPESKKGSQTDGQSDNKSDSTPILEIETFQTVTALERSVDPLIISGYARDSVKDGEGTLKGTAGGSDSNPELNISPIAKEQTGFPKDVFPTYTASNAELAQDDYIFPLYRGKFTNRKRELCYDGNTGQNALGRSMLLGKTLLGNELDLGGAGFPISLAIDAFLNEAVPTVLGDMRVKSWNGTQAARYMDILKGKNDQCDDQKTVQFGTLKSEGWTTLKYYKDILLHEEAQQRKIVCINMGTNFVNVKLGQKIKINGLDDVYVIIQIQQNSEVAWKRNYDRYGMEADDKDTGVRSLKIYAIPGYGDDNNQFIPPVHPVPVIRKVGPQTAFVTDNEDPKFQGRVRIAFPWQSLGGPERSQLNEVAIKLHEMVSSIEDLRKKEKMLLEESTKACQYLEELKKYVNATKDEREELLKQRKQKVEDIKKDLDQFKASLNQKEKEEKEAQKEKTEKEIAEFEAAAKEHDERKGKAGYQNPEKDNTIIRKYKDLYDKKNGEYLKAHDDLQTAGNKEKAIEAEGQKLKEKIEESVYAMSSPWVRVVTPMASPGGGTFFRPRVGDEVMVNFENDNVERPYVIGSVFSKNTLTPDEKMYRQRGPELQGKDVSMMMVSPNGHHITFTDPDGGTNFLTNLVSPGLGLWGTIVGGWFNSLLPGAKDLAGGIHIGDRYGLYEIDMKSHKRSIEINSPFGTVAINAFSGITISAPNGNVTIKGKNINLEASNKVNVFSGLNIDDDPGFGDPEGKAYQAGKALTDLFAEIIPAELTKYMFSSVTDLSYIRHVVEVFVRPVDGTLKLKSKRYLMLEAGRGNATIRHDRYATAVAGKKESQEEFFKAMLAGVKFICEKVDLFYDTYEALWADGYKKRIAYEDTAYALKIKDVKNPNLRKLAYDTTDEWTDDIITESTYKDILASTMFHIIKDPADAFAEAAFKIYRHVESFEEMLKDYSALPIGNFPWIGDCFMTAIGNVNSKCKMTEEWAQAFAKGKEDELFNDSNPDPKTDKFAMANKKLFKRKLLLCFIHTVGKDPGNEKGKYFNCGLRIDEILKEEWIRQEFYWNRTVFFLDRDKRMNYHNFWRKLYDNTWGMVVSNAKKIAAPFDRDIWNDTADGQILFSEKENKTLNFQGEGLHEESSSNIGTLAHLKKELMAIK